MFLTLIGFSEKSYSQCCNTSQYPFSTILAPSSGATQVISSCSYLSEYSVVSSIVAGSSYTLDVASTNAWVTIYSGSSCGTFIASGASPLTFSAPSSGTYYIHWTVDALCATSTGCKTTTITENIYGCTSSIAMNYNPQATIDDGSCSYSICSANEQEIVITITTDDFPEETSWQLVDQNGGGFSYTFTPNDDSLTTYVWSLCVPDTNCYQFTISDTYGDGLCGSCSGGTDGNYNITYAGAIVASSNVANFGSSETTYNIGTCLFPPSSCPNNDIEVIITINTDDYPNETSWFLMDEYGGGLTNQPISSSYANTTLVWKFCVPDTNCYTFTMLDSYGDGICCAWGVGSYSVSYDGVVVASGGAFSFSEENCDIGSCFANCQIVIPNTVINEGENCGSDINHGCDDKWKISNFTIQGLTDDCSWGYAGNWPPCFAGGASEFYPDLYIYMQQNGTYFHYTDYYIDTWYPNSFSMLAGQSTSALELTNNGLYSSPYVSGQTFSYDFSVYDDDDGMFQQMGLNNDDFIGSYTLPSSLVSGVNSITTSGGAYGNANVDYTVIAPSPIYSSLSNASIIHGTFWAENNNRDTDWYEFVLSDSSNFLLKTISEAPFNVILFDASSGCSNPIVIDSTFGMSCDTVIIQQLLSPGSYWLLAFPTAYSCMSCSESIDYLLDVSWTVNIVSGCTDPTACNYDTLATVDDGSCILPDGCTDSLAFNYNPFALCDDGSCIAVVNGCIDTLAINYNVNANVDDGSCSYHCANTSAYGSATADPYGLVTVSNCNYLSEYSTISGVGSGESYTAAIIGPNAAPGYIVVYQGGSSTNFVAQGYSPLIWTSTVSGTYYIHWMVDSTCAIATGCHVTTLTGNQTISVSGCTDTTALNYNPIATVDDGTCIFCIYGCTDPTAFNYNAAATCDDSSCIACIYGCTDLTAFNYDSLATCNDGSCIAIVYGCSDPVAFNYYAGVNFDDGSCCYISGCTGPSSCNYDPNACVDDGSCIYISGCTDPSACNYDLNACVDDGSCEWNSCASTCTAPSITGLSVSSLIHDRVTLNFDNMNTYDASGAQVC
ncbi:MAG: hypothetical protein CMD14_09605, partial [Flavobacteriales bacterium]|nr:hypothetical protein [Flavobacteriales bacterium]